MSIADKLTQVANNIPKVYEAGKKTQYDEFWDNFQDNGNRTDYQFAFGGFGWNDITFKPKYDITITKGMRLFTVCKVTDLVSALKKQGVELITSNATDLTHLFNSSYLTHIPVVDTRSVSSAASMFNYSEFLVSIEKLIVHENLTFNSTFNACGALKNLIIEGTIGQNGFNVRWSIKLSGESIVSIIEALSTTTTNLTVTLSQTAVNNMTFPITSAQTNTTYNSWDDLIDTKSNWTISLA